MVMQIWFADYNSGWSGISRLEFVAKWCSQVSNSNAVLLFLSSKGWSLGRAGIALFRIHKYSRLLWWMALCHWELSMECWAGCKARLPVGADERPLLIASHLHGQGKLLQPWEIPNPLGPAVSEGYQEGGGSFFTQKGALCFQVQK